MTSPDFAGKLRVLLTTSLPIVQVLSAMAWPEPAVANAHRAQAEPDAIRVPFLSNSLLVITPGPAFFWLDVAAILVLRRRDAQCIHKRVVRLEHLTG